MKKLFSLIAVVAMICMFTTTAFAASNQSTDTYYDANGNYIYGNDYYYDNDGVPMYGGNCYYMDGRNRVYVPDQQAYVYDADGNLTAADYFYDSNGKAITSTNMSTYGYYNCYWGYYGNNSNGTNSGRRGYGCGCGWCW